LESARPADFFVARGARQQSGMPSEPWPALRRYDGRAAVERPAI